MFSDRKAFNFFKSYWEIGKELDDVNRVMFYDALLKLQFTGEETELSGMAKFAWISQKHSINSQLKGLESRHKAPVITNPNRGANGGAGLGGNGGANPQVQEKEEEKVQVKVQLVKESINDRKLKFASTLEPFLEIYGKDFLNDFFKYWTEPNKSGTKFKQELEKTWSLERRLETWAKNDKNFNKTQNGKPATEKPIIGRATESVIRANLEGWE